MGVEGVVRAPFIGGAEIQSQRFSSLHDAVLGVDDVRLAAAVSACQVFHDGFTLRRHIRVKLEGMPVDLEVEFVGELAHGLFESPVTDGAPGTGHIGDDIDAYGIHASSLILKGLPPSSRRAGLAMPAPSG